MSATKPDFLAIEIDDVDAKLDEKLDAKLAETARRKRIPTLTLETSVPPVTRAPQSSEELGGDSSMAEGMLDNAVRDNREGSTGRQPVGISGPEPTHRPRLAGEEGAGRQLARRRPLSLEVPDYLARELKVKAATEGVTVRFLVLSTLAAAGYRVDSDELEEDGRRLR